MATRTPGRKLRGALVGYGLIGARGHLPAYRQRDDVEIAAVADVCEARRALAAQQVPGARLYASAEALLAAEAGRLDFADVATPPCDHAAIAHRALDLGLHVLCEKPLTTSLADATALLEHAVRARRVIFPCHNYKHAPVITTVGEVVRSGRIGRVRSVTLGTFRNTHALGVPEWNPHWRRQVRWSGGGIAMDHGSHTLYLAFDWLGAWPTAVTAKMANQEADRWDTEDNFSAVLTFPGGRLAHAHLSWTAGVRKVIYTVQGEGGAVTVDDDHLQVAVMRRPAGPGAARGEVTWEVERRTIDSEWMDASHTRWFDAMFDQFLAAMERGEFAGAEAQDAWRCIEVITTAYRSAADACRELPLAPAGPVGRGGPP